MAARVPLMRRWSKWFALPAAVSAWAVARLGAYEVGALVAVFIGAGLFLAFGALAEEVVEGETHQIDMAVLMAFRTPGDPTDRIGPPWFEEMMRDVTALGSYVFVIIVVVAALGYLLLARKRGLAILMGTAVLGGMLISNLLKNGFDRPRPDIEHAVKVFTPELPKRTCHIVRCHVPDPWSASYKSKRA